MSPISSHVILVASLLNVFQCGPGSVEMHIREACETFEVGTELPRPENDIKAEAEKLTRSEMPSFT